DERPGHDGSFLRAGSPRGRLGVPVQEFDFGVDHSVVVLPAFVDVIVVAAAAEQLRVGCSLGDTQGGADGGDRVVLGDDEEDRAADLGCLSYRPVGGETEERAGGDAVVPLAAVFGADDL